MAKNLYCVIGLPCAGKSYTASLIQKKFIGRGHVVSAGDIARQLMTTPELKAQTAANDQFPLEDLIRSKLQADIEDLFTKQDVVVVEGMPRFADQANWAIDTFWLYNIKIIEVSVGDPITLFNRARLRNRDTDSNFAQRLDVASKNMAGIYDVLHQRLIQHYTVYSGNDEQMVLDLSRHLTCKALP